MEEVVAREFSLPDEDLLVNAQAMHDALVDEQAKFEAHFANAKAEETAAFQMAILAAAALPLDGNVTAINQVLTQDLATQVTFGRSSLKKLRHYATEAWPDDLRRQRIFGQDDWDKAAYDPEKMRDALEHAFLVSGEEEYKIMLDAVGYKPELRMQLDVISKEITQKQRNQKLAQKKRPVSTQDRIRAYNTVFRFMKLINNRAQVVWENDPERRAQYNLYPPTSATDAQTITVTAYRAGSTTPLEGATVTITNTTLPPATTDAEGKATFSAKVLPDLLDIRVTHPVEGIAEYSGLMLEEGGEGFVLEVPHGVGT